MFCTEAMFSQTRILKAGAILVIAILIFMINFMILKNPISRKHSGIIENDMTIEEYISELDPKKIKKIEEQNGGSIPQNSEEESSSEANSTSDSQENSDDE